MKSHMGQDKNSDAKDHSAIPTSLFQSALMANTGATQQMKGDLEGSESFTRAPRGSWAGECLTRRPHGATTGLATNKGHTGTD